MADERETPDAELADAVRDTAYFLWEQDGRPPGREEHYWQKALDQHLRQRAFDIWLREGQPEGKAEEHWQAALEALEAGPEKSTRDEGEDQL